MTRSRKAIASLIVASFMLGACAAPAAAPQAPAAPEAPAATEAPAAPAATQAPAAPSGEVVKPQPGKAVKMVLLPKFLGIAVFDQANQGAQEAHKELGNPEKLEFLGPTPE
ncbi:MAG: sugar ABC transporter substrate-binding protein, partial [Candidatus Brachytrichaceae bacterium NZ_4S206]